MVAGVFYFGVYTQKHSKALKENDLNRDLLYPLSQVSKNRYNPLTVCIFWLFNRLKIPTFLVNF